jgi:acetoin utilization protein AcuB
LEEAARIMVDHKIGGLPVMSGRQLVGLITETDIFRVMMEALGGRSEGLRITVNLQDDNGELGAITDGIIQLGGKLISLSTFWGSKSHQRMLTLKVQGVYPEELTQMMENFIGVQVIYCRGNAEFRPEVLSPAGKMDVSPVMDLKISDHWFLG